MRLHALPLPARLSLLLLFAAAPAWAAWPHDPLVNLQVAPAFATQIWDATASDGAGGAFIAYSQYNGVDYDVYAQHVTATGGIAAGWPAGGLAVCTVAGDQQNVVAVADGAGGVIVAWDDSRPGAQRDIYAQRITGAGALAPGWPANGRVISASLKDESAPVLCSDGARGAFLVWTLTFTPGSDNDIYGAHVDSAATIVWGNPIHNPAAHQDDPAIAADGMGGCVIAWRDNGSGADDIRVCRRNAAGTTLYGPLYACFAGQNQIDPHVTCDGAGAAIVTWTDARSGTSFDIYALGLTAGGAMAPGWVTDGRAVCTSTGSQFNTLIVSDGGHGAYIGWTDQRAVDQDVYLQRLAPGGTPYPGWPANGLALCSVPGGQALQGLTSDSFGGVIASWVDARTDPAQDVFALRVTPGGAVAPGWTANGTLVCAAASSQDGARVCADDAGNAIVAWHDVRTGGYNVYAQRIDVFGQLGNPEPAITKIRDVLADQGGRVRIDWNASWMDANPTFGVGQYWIWREAPAAQVQQAVARGASLLDAGSLDALAGSTGDAFSTLAARGLFTTTSVGAVTFSWEYLDAVQASGFPTYSYVAATTTDSTAAHNYRTAFMVQARAPSGVAYWSSAPDSGYSVDNLAPVAPAPFLAAYSGGATHLHWGANVEADLSGYRLYRGATSGFVPAPGNLVSAQPDTGYDDPGAAGSWYKLSAVDVHGNESAFAVLGPSGTTDVETLPRELSVGTPSPNPARAAATLAFALPHGGPVSLAIYDAGGRRVRSLVAGPLPAGTHASSWSLTDASGHAVPSGVYFARFEAEGRTFTRRIAVMR